MPNARRVRQDAEAAARRYAEYGKLIAGYNANVDKMNSGNAAAVDLYNQQVQEFKDFQKKVESGQEYAVADVGFGNLFGGFDPYENAKAEDMIVNGQIQKPFNQEDQKLELDYHGYVTQQQQKLNLEYLQSGGTELAKAPQYVVPEPKTSNLGGFEIQKPADPNVSLAGVNSSNDPNAPPRPTPTYVAADSEEGKKLLADWRKPVGQFAMIKGKDGKLVAAKADQRGIKDAGFMVDVLPYPMPDAPGGIGGIGGTDTYWLRNGDGTATQYVRSNNGPWQAVTPAIRILSWDKKAPVQQTDAGAVPEEPKAWNPSLRELAELKSPTTNAAGANMAAAMGSYAKTGLMNEASRNNQSLTNSDTGVLNRVMQGIL